jgi:pimeloyl-ACP methyl ester carboxylesterase
LYTYVSNNPLIYADPSGNKAWLIHGTWSNPTKSWGDDNSFDKYIEGLFNESSERFKWSGGNTNGARSEAAEDLFEKVYEWQLENPDEPIRLVGHSHGGNVAIMVANLLAEKGVKVETLITIATPVRGYHLDKNTSVGQYIHVYNNKDQVQKNGGSAWLLGNTYTRKFKGAENVRAKDAEKPGVFSPNGGPIDSHSSMHSNINIWKKYIEPILKKKN